MPGRIALLAALVLGVGCGRAEPTGSPIVLLVGVDGLEWSVLLPLLEDGELPVLEGLMAEGSYGLLETLRPTFSPILWTTIATGKPAAKHGIRGFVRSSSEDGG